MIATLQRALVFVLYQLTVIFGIAMLPVALAANRAGITLPVGRLIDRTNSVFSRVVTEQ